MVCLCLLVLSQCVCVYQPALHRQRSVRSCRHPPLLSCLVLSCLVLSCLVSPALCLCVLRQSHTACAAAEGAPLSCVVFAVIASPWLTVTASTASLAAPALPRAHDTGRAQTGRQACCMCACMCVCMGSVAACLCSGGYMRVERGQHCRQRSYHCECTGSRPITEVKRSRAQIVRYDNKRTLGVVGS